MQKNIYFILNAILFFLLAYIWLPLAPVNQFSARLGDEIVYAFPAPNAWKFETEYIHSLQLTPVIDDYRLTAGSLWSWEERVQSHNAGLPFAKPQNGRLIVSSPWFVFQGGRQKHRQVAYRVGSARLGHNIWRMPPHPDINIFEIYEGKRFFLRNEIVAWGQSLTVMPE